MTLCLYSPTDDAKVLGAPEVLVIWKAGPGQHYRIYDRVAKWGVSPQKTNLHFLMVPKAFTLNGIRGPLNCPVAQLHIVSCAYSVASSSHSPWVDI